MSVEKAPYISDKIQIDIILNGIMPSLRNQIS